MEKLEQYESMLSTLKNIIKEEKALIKYREKRAGMSSCSPKEFARLSDKQTDIAFQIKKLRDDLHAQVVDASLADPYDIEHYKGREITQSAGLGGTYSFLYIPKKPKIYQKEQR